jgi:ribosomal protein S18 acetylase RimI-like enzyme
MADDGLRIVAEEDPSPADEALIKEALGKWNIAVTGYSDYHPAYFLVRDDDGAIRGALLAYVWGRWLHVDTLWLEEGLRRKGWGTRLMEAAHEVGREKGAEWAFLDTFSWQARPFYERLGYEVVFEVPEFPPGHSRSFMRKDLR